jgi:acetate kinase
MLLKVLVFNCGSSTLKFQILETVTGPPGGIRQRLAWGSIERIGAESSFKFVTPGSEDQGALGSLGDHGEAARTVIRWLDSRGLLAPGALNAVGHRVVHGGQRFSEPAVIDEEVLRAIAALEHLAPLHNRPSLRAIQEAREALGPRIPMVAVFDTAFHRSIPDRAALYAIPSELAARHQVRRYGFHGLAHRWMVQRYAEMMAIPPDKVTIVTLQLGAGCSAAAVKNGRPVDTSMGFTPLEGLMMATRSGDLDPSLPGFLAEREGLTLAEVVEVLNTRSGVLGVSGRSADMRQLLEAESLGDARAALAVEMFCYRVRKCIASYMAALGGAQALVFGGGIGENAPPVRARICSDMEWCGLILDGARNSETIGSEGRISTEASKIQAYVIPVDEESVIACDTARCLSEAGMGGGGDGR